MSKTEKEKIEKYSDMLKRRIQKRDFVQIHEKVLDVNRQSNGFILKKSKKFLLLQFVHEFQFDGYKIIPQEYFESLVHGDAEKTCKEILIAEGAFEQYYGLDQDISLKNFKMLFEDLKKFDYHVTIEAIVKDQVIFFIGPIKTVSKKKLRLHHYDATGKIEKKPSTIRFDQITGIKFGDHYSTIFRKYLRGLESPIQITI